MSHDFATPRRRYERRVCNRCGNMYSALMVETGMAPPCHGKPAALLTAEEMKGRKITRPARLPSAAGRA